MAVGPFLDTSVLLAGLIDFGPQSAPAQRLLHAVAEKQVQNAATAWHCCLEFFSVATRLPPEYRLSAPEAVTLVESEVFARMSIHDIPASERLGFFRAIAEDAITGGRVYDAHIAEVARHAGAAVVVTDNRRHFVTALKHGLRVETPAEFVSALKSRRG
jgi:predicted nucleic acid-binding protein